MADSPGAIGPGITPEAASNTIVKVLLSAQGLALLGVGAWLLLRKKGTRKNPGRRRRNPDGAPSYDNYPPSYESDLKAAKASAEKLAARTGRVVQIIWDFSKQKFELSPRRIANSATKENTDSAYPPGYDEETGTIRGNPRRRHRRSRP